MFVARALSVAYAVEVARLAPMYVILVLLSQTKIAESNQYPNRCSTDSQFITNSQLIGRHADSSCPIFAGLRLSAAPLAHHVGLTAMANAVAYGQTEATRSVSIRCGRHAKAGITHKVDQCGLLRDQLA